MTNRRQTKEMYLTRWKWMIIAACIIQVIFYPVEGGAKKRTKLQPRKDGDVNTTTSDPGLPPNTDSPTSPPDQGTTPDPGTSAPDPPDTTTDAPTDAPTDTTTDVTTEANTGTTEKTVTDISNSTNSSSTTESTTFPSSTEDVPPAPPPAPTEPAPGKFDQDCDGNKKKCDGKGFLECRKTTDSSASKCLCLEGLKRPPTDRQNDPCTIPYDQPCPYKSKEQKSSKSRTKKFRHRRATSNQNTGPKCYEDTECSEVNKNKFCRPAPTSRFKSMIVSPNAAGAIKRTLNNRARVHRTDEYRSSY